MDHLLYWIWLSLRAGAGSELGSYLLKYFPSPKEIYEADEATLRAIEGIDDNLAAALLDRDLTMSEKILRYCERCNVGIMTAAGGIYPERLRGIHAKPLVLYYRGRVPDIDDNVLIACVGTRKCSERGAEAAYRLGAELAQAGAIVVSGMALGIDAYAHRGALKAGGHTIAVLGCGIDRVYPSEHKALMDEIAERGTLLTEFAPGTDPNGKNFPIRNRIISGLSQATVVVEANLYSGSLITARYAKAQGREVFACPGHAGDPLAEGTNQLIQNGAKLVTCAADILDEYELLYPHRIFTENIPKRPRNSSRRSAQISAPKKDREAPPMKKAGSAPTPAEPSKNKNAIELDGLEKQLYDCFSGVMTSDELAAELSRKYGISCDVGTLLGALTMLEIGGFIEALPGGSYRIL